MTIYENIKTYISYIFAGFYPDQLSGWVGLSKKILVGLFSVPKDQRKKENLVIYTTVYLI